MRKLLASVAAIALTGGMAYAVNVTPLSGPTINEPSQLMNGLNTVINSFNFGTSGNLGYVAGPLGAVGTTVQQSIAFTTVNTGQLSNAGQALLARCYGISANNTHVKQVGIIAYGTQATNQNFQTVTPLINSLAPYVSSTAFSVGNENWDVELLYQLNTTPATANAAYIGRAWTGLATGGTAGLGAVATPQIIINIGNDTSSTENLAVNGLTFACQAGLGTAAGGDVTMEGFSVQQVK